MKENDIELIETICARVVHWKELYEATKRELTSAYTVSSERANEIVKLEYKIAQLTDNIEALKLLQLTRGDK